MRLEYIHILLDIRYQMGDFRPCQRAQKASHCISFQVDELDCNVNFHIGAFW